MVGSLISGEGEVWMNTDVRELSFNETDNEAGLPSDGPAVDVQLEGDDDVSKDDEFDDKDSDELEDDEFEEEELEMEDVEDFEDEELLDDENDDDLDDIAENEF
jgi:hypothetical protein